MAGKVFLSKLQYAKNTMNLIAKYKDNVFIQMKKSCVSQVIMMCKPSIKSFPGGFLLYRNDIHVLIKKFYGMKKYWIKRFAG